MSDVQPARILVDGTPFELFHVGKAEPPHFIVLDRRTRILVEEKGRIVQWPTEAEARAWCKANRQREPQR